MREFDYLIHLVRCAIHNEQPRQFPEDLDLQRVFEWGVYHQVANIAFYSIEKLEKKPDAALYSQWEACRDRAVILDINQSFAAEELRAALAAAEVRTLEVQGTKIKPLYPQPDYRTMSDIDFIIDPENLPGAMGVLESLGYRCREAHGVEVVAFRPPNIHVELHTQYFSDRTDYYGMMRPPFASMEETGVYDVNEFYIYNMLHIAKHYLSGGCGIRRVLDVYYLNRCYGDRIDQKYVRGILKAAKAQKLVADLSALAQAWFGEGQLADAQREMASYIMGSGVHGNKRNELDNRLKKDLDKNARFGRSGYLLRRLFCTREILYKTYPILQKHKLLYPFCWLHRLFCALRPAKLKRLKREVDAVIDTKNTPG